MLWAGSVKFSCLYVNAYIGKKNRENMHKGSPYTLYRGDLISSKLPINVRCAVAQRQRFLRTFEQLLEKPQMPCFLFLQLRKMHWNN